MLLLTLNFLCIHVVTAVRKDVLRHNLLSLVTFILNKSEASQKCITVNEVGKQSCIVR